MKKIIFLLTSLTLLTSPAFAQKGSSASGPVEPSVDGAQTPVNGASGVTGVTGTGATPSYNFQGECHFRPNITQEDQSLLTNAKSAIESIKNNSACQPLQNQFNAFESAMTNYNRYTGADRVPGYDGNVNVNCVNYEQIYDMSYDFFVSNHSSSNNNLPREYSSCSNPDRTAAINCAAEATGRLKAVKRLECEQSGQAINEAERSRLIADSYSTGLAAMTAIINNDQCIDATGAQRMSFIQSAVGLAGRAAIIGAGPVAGPLIGMATNLVGSLINRIFRSNNRSSLEQLENRGNMAELACLYEKLEDKAQRCDRVIASIGNEFSLQSYQHARSCIQGSHRATTEVDRLLGEASEIVRGINAPPAEGQDPQEFSQEMFEDLVDSLSESFPGGNEPIIAVGSRAADQAVTNLEQALSTDENLRAYLQTQNPNAEVNSRALRRARGEIEPKLAKARRVQSILEAIRNTDSKSQITSEDLVALRTTLGGTVNFMGEFNEVLRMGISGTDSLSEQISLYNSQLSEARTYQSVISTYQANEAKRNTRFSDDGTFELARNSLRPYLARMLEEELDSLKSSAIQNLSSVTPGPASSQALRDQRMTQEENYLYPIVRACNQLQSVMNEGDRSGNRPIRINNQHDVCQAVTCSGGSGRGVQSFTDFLQQNNLPIPESDNCAPGECTANYSRYICQQKRQLPTIRNNMANEFINEGKICGRSLRDALASSR